ncbi:UNVERIFIED_CONTAM: hypothetical protein Sradi_2323400 [Sesamum radiatum]|uniref:DUF4283 domain-containing protein n=1 Tax=Sesamum radiatum TaxID=300843 RepID=A0AAW2T4J1_SESRA
MMIDMVTTTTISEPPIRTPEIGEHTAANIPNHDPTTTGLFIGNIPLLNDPTVVDKFAEAFNNSSRKTLSYIPLESQNGEIVIRPLMDVIRDGLQRWKTMAVGYFLGKKLFFHHLNEIVRSIWPLVMEVIATVNGFYFFKFKIVVAMEEIIDGGPWLFQGHPIVLQQWEPKMALRKHKHSQVSA